MNSSYIVEQRDYQEQLYENIVLLNKLFPPSRELKAVLRKDMFAKSNKEAFNQLIHFLLNVLDSEVVKEKLKSWPTMNIIQRENKFRSEVCQVLNELNSKYETDLPVMFTSHLVAPGGSRLVHYLFKLSQLVMYEVLNKMLPIPVLKLPKAGKNAENFRSTLVRVTNALNAEINGMMVKFERKYEMFQQEALRISDERTKLNEKLKEIQVKIQLETNKLNQYDEDNITGKIQTFEEKNKSIQDIVEAYDEVQKLLTNLVVTNSEIHDSEMTSLDLVKNVRENVEKKSSQIPNLHLKDLEANRILITEKQKKIEKYLAEMKETHQNFMEKLEISKVDLKSLCEDIENAENASISQ